MAGSTDHSIRVTARGEFGDLERGLKNLTRDLSNVTNVVDKGARKGGFFDQDSLRALEIYNKRFKSTMGELEREFSRQNNAVDRLHQKMASLKDPIEKSSTQTEINRREKGLDPLRKQIRLMEDLNDQRQKEYKGFQSSTPAEKGKVGQGSKADPNGAMLGVMGRVGVLGKMVLGLAGIGGIMSVLQQSYEGAHDRAVNSLDLAQRTRGYGGRSGDARSMYKDAGDIGMSDRMGYTDKESWQFMDAYTQKGGGLSGDDQYKLQKFSRGYGLDLNSTGAIFGQAHQMGITNSGQYADNLSGSVESSGMKPRILEVMETSVGLLQTINTSLKDGDAKTILAYQTTLDKFGNENGMQKLTGAQGGNLISGLNGMFSDADSGNNYYTMAMMQRQHPDTYGKQGFWQMRRNVSEGLSNPDVLNSWWGGIKEQSGEGEDKYSRRGFLLEQGLKQYGMNPKKAYELAAEGGAMDTITSKEQLQKATEDVDNGNSVASYDKERKGEKGQTVLDVEAHYQRALADFGEGLLTLATGVKTEAVKFLSWLTPKMDELFSKIDGWVATITKKLNDAFGLQLNQMEVGAGILGGLMALPTIVKGLAWLKGKLPNTAEAAVPAAEAGAEALAVPAAEAGAGATATGAGIAAGGSVALAGALALAVGSIGGLVVVGLEKTLDDAGWLKVPKLSQDGSDALVSLSTNGGLSLSSLDDVGTMTLARLEAEGNIKLGDLDEKGRRSIEFLSSDGAKQLYNLQKSGNIQLVGMNDTTSKHLDTLIEVHQSWWSKLADLWRTWFGGGKGSKDTPGGSGIGWENYDITKDSGLSEDQLNKSLEGVEGGQGFGSVFKSAGAANGIDPAFLVALAKQEQSYTPQNNNLGGIMSSDGKTLRNFDSVADSISAMAKLAASSPEKTIAGVGKWYAPLDDPNDTGGLNKNWIPGVGRNLSEMGISAPGGNGIFNWGSWKSSETDGFGSTDGRSTPHVGTDIGVPQGTQIPAPMGGVISQLERDPDNTSPNGNAVKVQLDDGSSYKIIHMAEIGSQLALGNYVNQGALLGKSGGEPGEPGTGNDSTGPHVHISAYGPDGNIINSDDWLADKFAGTGSAGTPGAVSTSYNPNTPDTLGAVNSLNSNNSSGSVSSAKELTVNVNLTGDGADKLSGLKSYELVSLIKQVISDVAQQHIQLNPSSRVVNV